MLKEKGEKLKKEIQELKQELLEEKAKQHKMVKLEIQLKEMEKDAQNALTFTQRLQF